jgi:hypothetical protein
VVDVEEKTVESCLVALDLLLTCSSQQNFVKANEDGQGEEEEAEHCEQEIEPIILD